jgi:hypothetical protein
MPSLTFNKIPKNILIIDKLNPEIDKDLKNKIFSFSKDTNIFFCDCIKDSFLCEICIKNKEMKYDLVFLCNYSLSFNLKSPLNICESEIIFNRKRMDFGIFMKGIEYYLECEIRNGG